MLASAAIGVVCGLGVLGYELALRGLVDVLRARRSTGVAVEAHA
jgi:3-dehydroquinate dehydratase